MNSNCKNKKLKGGTLKHLKTYIQSMYSLYTIIISIQYIACGPKSIYLYLNWAFKQESPLKGATISTRAASKWGGVMIKLSGLSPCLLYSAANVLF